MSGLEWQPITWHFFHTIALNYNDEYKEEYINFFHTFKTILPCKMCRDHYSVHLKKPNMSIEENINSQRIFNWTIDLHNIVNKSNQKSIWSYDTARQYYQQHNFTNQLYKIFLLEYVKNNLKKHPIKTTELLKMIRTLPYFHPVKEKRDKLIDYKNKFELNKKNVKQWLIAFLMLLKV